jgi:hypothetical protein
MTSKRNEPSDLIRARTITGEFIRSLDDWLILAPPRQGEVHWQDFRSAKELAQSWLRNGQPAMPVEYTELLRTHRDTRSFEPIVAIAEMEIRIDEFGGPRNSDMVVIGQSGRSKILLAVEAKADEEFAKTIADELRGLPPNSNKPERVARLAAGVLNRNLDPNLTSLRYQLLHALAATAIEARSHQAKLGVLLIQEFISLTVDFEKVTRNASDLKAFVQTVPGWTDADLRIGTLLPPITLKGNEHLPDDQLVTIGKVRTLLPLHVGNRQLPPFGFDKKRRQFLVDV